jgi:hypothetical protein
MSRCRSLGNFDSTCADKYGQGAGLKGENDCLTVGLCAIFLMGFANLSQAGCNQPCILHCRGLYEC